MNIINDNLSQTYKEGFLSIQSIINDIERAIQANASLSALCLTISLISMCSNLEYPNDSDKNKFIQWINTYVDKKIFEKIYTENGYEDPKTIITKYNYQHEVISETIDLPMLTADLLYQIRCLLFHEVSNDIDFNNKCKQHQANQQLNHNNFVYILTNYISYMYHNVSSSYFLNIYSMHIPIEGLIRPLLSCIQEYCNIKNITKTAIHAIDFTNPRLYID